MDIQERKNENPISYLLNEALSQVKKKADIEFYREIKRIAERELQRLGD